MTKMSPIESQHASNLNFGCDLSTISVPNVGGRFSPPLKQFKENPESRLGTQRKENKERPQPRVVYKQTESSDDEDNDQFLVNPSEDIPRNKLVDKLVRGMQSYI